MKTLGAIAKLWRRVTKTSQRMEVWDTSAVSTWLDILRSKIESRDETKIVITEGVIHELSVGRHKFEKARNAYNYIYNATSDKILKVVTEDKVRAWTVDEQIIYTASIYAKSGHNVVLVTCDKDQAFRAGLQGIKTKLLEGNREALKTVPVQPKPKIVATSGEKQQNMFGNEIKLECTKRGQRLYISVISGIEIYDNRGKRRIGKDKIVEIQPTDKVVYFGMQYKITSITDKQLILEKK